MTEYNIKLTPSAINQIKKKLAHSGHLRLGLLANGCSGYRYVLEFEDSLPKERDIQLNIDGIVILIDNRSIIHLNGSTLDYQNSLMKKGFVFHNPNVDSTCGCGQSFSVKSEEEK
jgi:iron-sulfur cluster assembly protein